MANCANCGEVNPDTNAFCSKCGSPLPPQEEKSAQELAYENAQREFDNDAIVSADISKLTYICELCGTINRIENGACSKCGKPRPRSAYVKALNNYRQNVVAGKAMMEEKNKAMQAAAEKKAAEDAIKAAETAAKIAAKAEAEKLAAENAKAKANGTAIQAPVQEFVATPAAPAVQVAQQQNAQGVAPVQPVATPQDANVAPVATQNANVAPAAAPAQPMAQASNANQVMVTPTANGGVMINRPAPATQQAGSVVQPFVIVPYVDSTQKLWQYQPRQIYKFEPYSYEQKERLKQRQLELQQGKDPTIEELNRMRDRKQGEINSLNDVIDSKLPVDQRLVTYNAKKQKIRSCAVVTLIFSVLMLLATIALPVFKGDMSTLRGFEIFKYIGNCLKGAGIAQLPFVETSAYGYNGLANFVLPIVYIISTVLTVAVAIQSVVRLVNGNAATKGYIMPLIILILGVAAFISLFFFEEGSYNANTFNTEMLANAITNINYGFYVYIVTAIAMVISGACAPVNGKSYR